MKAKMIATVLLLFVFNSLVMGQSYKPGKSNVVVDPEKFSGLTYRCIGPSRGGRVTTVTGIADQPGTFYMGSTGGGVWKTTDYGQTWFNISDGYFATSSIGAIQVADSDTNIIYVGTGSDGIRSNVITGRGVYKSTDAGKTWKFVGLEKTGQIGAVEIHPQNPDIVFIAALGSAFGSNPQRGVFRTTDGGKTWENVLFVSDSTGAIDLEFSPNNPDEIYACMWHGVRKPWTIISGGYEGGIYKSNDGGNSWKKLTNGLPHGLFGKSDLAVTPAAPDFVYALIEAPEGEGGVYRSEDRGLSFQLISTKYELLDRPFYYTNIDVDPTNADIVYVNSTRFFKSIDGGKSWKRLSTPHGDNHDMWINPNDPDIFIQSNDGGVNVTRDGGKTWSTQNNQPTAEIYQVAVDDQFPYWIYGGQQDNSTIMVPSLPPYMPAVGAPGFWRAIGGCETGPAVPKPGNPDIVYANCKGRFGRYNKKTGQEKQYYVGAANMYGHNPRNLKYRFQRVSPIHISPLDPNVVYHASQYLHKTTDEGVTWETISPDLTANESDKQVISGSPITRDITGEEFYSTIYAVQESPLQQGLIWVGANDGPVHETRDGGKTWTDVTPAGLSPGGRVQTVEPSPHRANKAYIAVYRYLLNDWQPYIFRTNDYGKTWQRLTTGKNGIPADCPTRVIREDPDREGLLYAGTEFGMFISFDDGQHWQSLQLNLPITPVTDIKVYRKDLVLSTMGRSFWILDNITPLHQLLNDDMVNAKVYLFEPNRAWRMHYRTLDDTPANPEYPPPGAIIDYYLAEEPTEDITLEILDRDGHLIRSFSSTEPQKEWVVPAQLELKQLNLQRTGTEKLSKEQGMHRIIWDLRHAGAWHSAIKRAGRHGPLVVPGMYQVKLTVGMEHIQKTLQVQIDPRVADDVVTLPDLQEQESLSLKIRDALSKARILVQQIKEEREKLQQAMESRNEGTINQAKEQNQKLAEIQDKLVTPGGRYPRPRLIDQLSYLYSMLNQADQKPGRDAYERYDELDRELLQNIEQAKKVMR